MGNKTGIKKHVSPDLGKGDQRVKNGNHVRAASVPEGRRPVLIVEPEEKELYDPQPRPDRRRRDPMLEPEVVAARASTETIKGIGKQLATLTELSTGFLDRADRALDAVAAAESLAEARLGGEKVRELFSWMECVNRDLAWLAGKHEVGMATLDLPSMIRDSVKRAYHGSPGVNFRLPDITTELPVMAHPQHLQDALTLAVSIVLERMCHHGDLEVNLAKGRYFVQVRVVGHLREECEAGDLPRAEDPARLRHLIVGLHQGTVSSSTGDNGEVVITIGLPLRSFQAEAR